MVLYSPDWTHIGCSFRLLTVNLFRHPTLIEHGLYSQIVWFYVVCFMQINEEQRLRFVNVFSYAMI